MKKRPHILIYSPYNDTPEMFCSECLSLLYGNDETPCPVCRAKLDMTIQKEVGENEFERLYEKIAGSH